MELDLDRAGAELDRLVDDGSLVGWVAGTHHRGGSTTSRGGRRSIAGPPMTPDTLFAIASCTKPMAGALALRLVEAGTLALADPVVRWLPELAAPRVLTRPDATLDETVAAARDITVRDLLTMTPGFGLHLEPTPLAEAMQAEQVGPGPTPPPMGPDEYLRRLGSLPLAEQPGTRWRYHTSSDVLGVLLARATGRPVGELLEAELTGPLGMGDTAFVATDPERLATAYGPGSGGGLAPYPLPAGSFVEPPAFESLAAGLVSTVPDQLAFLSALVAADGGVLGRESTTAMGTDQLTPDQRRGAEGFLEDGVGWGLHVEVRPGGVIGWAGGLGTIGYADPRDGSAAVLFTQQSVEMPGTAAAFECFARHLVGG